MSGRVEALLENPFAAGAMLVVGVVMLLGGGRILVDGSVAIARRLGVSTLLIGMTVVAFGTSAPELAFNVIAGLGGHGDLAFGNIIGSNIANLGLILGITALVSRLDVHSRVVTIELPWLIAVSAGMIALVLVPLGAGGATAFSRPKGIILLAVFAAFMMSWRRMGRKDRSDPLLRDLGRQAEREGEASLGLAIVLTVAGLALLLSGGKATEWGAVAVARHMGLSEALIGLTIVAVATSLPELVTGIVACRQGHPDLAVGNVVGSNLFNVLLVLGLTATIAEIPCPRFGLADLIAMTLLTALMLPIAMTHRRTITRTEGAVLLALYLGYMTWSVVRELGG